MSRTTFLTLASFIALAVGSFALLFPSAFLASKGVLQNDAASVWMRQMGVALTAMGGIAFTIRRQPDSLTMRAFLVGNAWLQLGLLPIEFLAFRAGTLTEFWGIVPNSVFHLVLSCAFVFYALKTKVSPQGSDAALQLQRA